MTILLILYSLWNCVELHFAVLPNKPPQHRNQENAHNWLKLNWLQCRSWKYSPGTRRLIWSTTWARWTKSQASSICTSLRILSMMTSAGNSPERVQSTHRPTTCNNIHHHQLPPCWQTTTHPHTISPFSLSLSLSAQNGAPMHHMRPDGGAVEQPVLLRQLHALRCARQSDVFHLHRPGHRELRPGVPRSRSSSGR